MYIVQYCFSFVSSIRINTTITKPIYSTTGRHWVFVRIHICVFLISIVNLFVVSQLRPCKNKNVKWCSPNVSITRRLTTFHKRNLSSKSVCERVCVCARACEQKHFINSNSQKESEWKRQIYALKKTNCFSIWSRIEYCFKIYCVIIIMFMYMISVH